MRSDGRRVHDLRRGKDVQTNRFAQLGGVMVPSAA